jgi:hypothetical protein
MTNGFALPTLPGSLLGTIREEEEPLAGTRPSPVAGVLRIVRAGFSRFAVGTRGEDVVAARTVRRDHPAATNDHRPVGRSLFPELGLFPGFPVFGDGPEIVLIDGDENRTPIFALTVLFAAGQGFT